MSGYNSVGTYNATSVIPEFRGLMQYSDGINTDPRYAIEERNVETKGGVLQPAAACMLLTPTLEAPIETLARLYRRWYAGDDKEILVAASGGKLYYMLPTAAAWTELAMPEGVDAYASNVWSWVAYEINPEGSEASVDVLLLSNAEDGMVMVRGDNMTVSVVATPKKFGVIERYAERIWGGAITDDPDMLVYSAPFDPTDWEANIEHPEDGAGDLNQPSWDGDSFTALRSFGAQLIAFKQNRIWRILGTDPGEYVFKEQYGGGAPYARTIAVGTEQILMLDKRGVMVYDGVSAAPYQQEYCRDFWARMSKPEAASAIYWHNRYYLSVAVDNSEINNAVIVYDPVDSTWTVREDVSVESWLGCDDDLYFTSSTTPGRIWKWQEDSWKTGSASAATAYWMTPWNDLGAKSVQETDFEIMFLAEVQSAPATLTFTLQTERKSKTKSFTVKPLTEYDIAKHRAYKQHSIHFAGMGRRFRLIIEGQGLWRLISGITIASEIDAD